MAVSKENSFYKHEIESVKTLIKHLTRPQIHNTRA